MLRIKNCTDRALSIDSYELKEYGILNIDIPYSSNIKRMEKYKLISVNEIDSESTVIKKQRQRKNN